MCTAGNPLDPLCHKRSRQFWAGSRPPCCVSHRGTYSPKYHWLSQYHVRARGRVLTESTRSSRLLAGGVRRHMLYHLPALPLPQHLQDENIYSSYTRLWLTFLVVGISDGKLNRHHCNRVLFLDCSQSYISCLGKRMKKHDFQCCAFRQSNIIRR